MTNLEANLKKVREQLDSKTRSEADVNAKLSETMKDLQKAKSDVDVVKLDSVSTDNDDFKLHRY